MTINFIDDQNTGLQKGVAGEEAADDALAEGDVMVVDDDKLKRLAADFSNYKKRVERERQEWTKIAENEVIKEILPIYDDFRLLMDHVEANSDLATGIKAIDDKWQQWLASYGVEQIAAVGRVFDPYLHEAAIEQPVADPTQDEMIINVIDDGYRRGGRVLRHARVAVGRFQDETEKN